MELRAEAIAKEGYQQKEKVLKEIQQREQQQLMVHRIRYLQGNFSTSSTTVLSVQEIEKAFLACKEQKQSFHTPFLLPPLAIEFGF